MGTDRRFAVALTLAATAFFAATAPAHGEIERPHSFAFKLGYHFYPNSSYFDVSEENFIGGAQDLSGQSLELFDYTYQWPSRWSLNMSLLGGYYQEFVPTQTAQQSIFVHTMTVTPLYRLTGSDAIGAWKIYGGVGLGRYNMNIRFDFSQTESTEVHTYTLGYQALIGAEYRYNEQTGFLIEGQFSRARIRFGSDLGDLEIDVGGLNILTGVRLHF
ncbi:MAG: hypothetical protein AB1451_14250 [Nitrospirota bacterium]